MCQSCFNSQWEDRDDDVTEESFYASLTDERKAAIREVLRLTRRDAVGDDWAGGVMHVMIDDDNYECDCADEARRLEWRAKWAESDAKSSVEPPARPTPEEENEWCAAWAGLSEDERALVVAVFHTYTRGWDQDKHGHLPPSEWVRWGDSDLQPSTS